MKFSMYLLATVAACLCACACGLGWLFLAVWLNSLWIAVCIAFPLMLASFAAAAYFLRRMDYMV